MPVTSPGGLVGAGGVWRSYNPLGTLNLMLIRLMEEGEWGTGYRGAPWGAGVWRAPEGRWGWWARLM